MKIQQWLGFNEESSPYLLRTGELRALVNLQARRPGMLFSRPGLTKLYGKYDDESVIGLYRRDTLVGDPNDYLCLQKAVIDRQLTIDQMLAGEYLQEFAWIIRRIQGYQERVISQIPISPTGESDISNFCVTEDRHGRLFLFFGHGAEPLMYRPSSLANSAISMGMEAPLIAPTIIPSGQGQFIETIDVTANGGGYYAPPSIFITGGSPDRPAKAKGIIQGGNLVGVDVIDGGANFKSIPKITVSSDKVGGGFRAVGNLEADPGVQGFVSTTPGAITGTGAGGGETVGYTDSVLNNKIMYKSVAVTAQTVVVPLANPWQFDDVNTTFNVSGMASDDGSPYELFVNSANASGSGTVTPVQNYRFMAVESVAGVLPGDIVTLSQFPSGTAVPNEFTSTSVIRVEGIDSTTKIIEGKSLKVIKLTKVYTPVINASWKVQFRRDDSIGLADAEWNATTKRFRASVPLRTRTGIGSGAEATLEFSPAAYSYGLGGFSMAGYTTPTGGVETPAFAWKQNGWDSYLYGEYWQGTAQDKKDSKENSTYAGLQASGSSYVFGYSGDITSSGKGKKTSRRADVYFPNYSKISVWLCTGPLSDNISSWTRIDADVVGGNTSSPYAIIDLKPTASSRISSQSGKMSYSTASKSYEAADDFRYPKIKIKLKTCPDSWVTTKQTNGSFNYNLPTSVKESQASRLAWWNSAATTPRPIVDLYRDASGTIAWDSIEVLDRGAGWELGTVFGLRIHQANPYDQRTDYNTAVRETSIKAGHQPFSTTSRYAQFVFKATEADSLTPAGPPAALVGSQYVDVSGSGYRTGDIAEVTVLKRKIASAAGTESLSFDGVVIAAGRTQEFVYDAGALPNVPSRNYQQPGAILINISGTNSKINDGDIVSCEEFGVLQKASSVIARPSGLVYLDKMKHCEKSPNAYIYGTLFPAPNDSQYYLSLRSDKLWAIPSTTLPEFVRVGRHLWATGEKGTADGFFTKQLRVRIDAIQSVYSNNAVISINLLVSRVSGTVQLTNAQYSFLPVFSFNVISGLADAQTVQFTAEQILAGSGEQRVTSIRIVSGGRDYHTAPTVLVRGGGNGYGLAVTPTVEGGKITACEITDPGRAYTSQPELYTESAGATAVPVMRPTMRGKYRCAYRFVDSSETEIVTTTITGVRGDSPTTIRMENTSGVTAGMYLASPRLPEGTKVVSVNGKFVNLNQEASGEGYVGEIIVEKPGAGYTSGETVTCTISGAVGATVSVTKAASSSGDYSVSHATVTSPGTKKFPIGRIPVSFSPPASGGAAASGYAIITQFDPASSYDKSVVVRDTTKPVAYSNFSPIVDIDAGPNDERPHCSELKWSIPGVTPPTRANKVELWRTSADQSLVFYRLEAYGVPTDSGIEIVGSDTLNDEELFDPDRPNYAAMPVVLPNGNLNAYRFGKPRTDMAVCVAFQDRLWYGVSTSGKDANTLYYSEFDEFESCPDANDLPIQNNQRATDSLTALVPYGSMLLAMQHSHTYAVTYNSDPGVDGAIQMLTRRGCLHQRCWDMNNENFYAVDESGIYSMDRSGNIQDISAPFREWFTSELIDFSKRDSFFLKVCPKTRILRFFCCLTSQSEDTPTFALCFDVDRKTWWTERYPNSLCSAITARPRIARINSTVFGAADGNLYELNDDADYANKSVTHCTVTTGGKGYKRSPVITCPSSSGVQLKGVVSEGRLVDIIVQSGGWDCNWGMQLMTESATTLGTFADSTYSWPPNGAIVGQCNLTTEDGRLLQGFEPKPIVLDIEAPPDGGTQAQAVAHYSAITKLTRNVTVAQGESFVRLATEVTDPIDSYVPPILTTPEGNWLCAVGTGAAAYLDLAPISTESLPVAIGMEAVGEFIPLNAFVSKIVGVDIYLEHPDGTPVSILGGVARVDAANDGWQESGGSPSTVYFYSPYKTHIPFRLATGAMQLLNEENITKNGDGLIDRSVTLVYTPTDSKKEVEVVQYYNSSSTPRANVMRRTRGGPGGFEHRQDSASTVLNLDRSASLRGDSTGVAKAMFAGRVFTDATGEDQHVQVELLGRPLSANGGADLEPHKFTMHSMTVNGVIDNGE